MGKEEEIVEKVPAYPDNGDRKDSTGRRRSSIVNPEVIAGEIFDERYERTQRGLKSR